MHSLYYLTIEQLEELVQDKYSTIKVEKRNFSIPLLPSSLDRIASEVLKIIHDWTYKYSIDLQGILLHHDQLQFLSDYGLIKEDDGFIYWDISARFYTFSPRIGAIIRGTINKFTKSNIMNAIVFNCIITTFTPDKVHPSISSELTLGQEILFRIESYDSDHSLIYGLIDEECVKHMKQQNLLII
ncbi:DNA-directed RNA polymerase I subunit RPA43-like [Tetranychus urticae]|uniref:Uncharacterized protein n=1 Tax=Tetranychus urticae TaxID=32264 RepID=T1JV71_TETUR|nr:DNA-directed RNA polymerase I subunit RPA43-like [Tetranychus urticae]